MTSLNVNHWRDLANHTEYLPPHLSIVEVQSQKSTNKKLSLHSSLYSSSSSSSSHNKPKKIKSHKVFLKDYPSTRKNQKTLHALVNEIEQAQKRDIQTRLTGHLNENHTFTALSSSTVPKLSMTTSTTTTTTKEPNSLTLSYPLNLNFNSNPTQQPHKENPNPIKASSLLTLEVLLPMQNLNLKPSLKSSSNLLLPLTTTTNSRTRSSTCPTFSNKHDQEVEKITFFTNFKHSDKLNVILHQLKEELQRDRHPLAQLAVAGQYFDYLIQRFHIYAPLFSEIKGVYDTVTQFYKNEMIELDILKRKLITEISIYETRVQLENDYQKRMEFLELENAALMNQLATTKAKLDQYTATATSSSSLSPPLKHTSSLSLMTRLNSAMHGTEFNNEELSSLDFVVEEQNNEDQN